MLENNENHSCMEQDKIICPYCDVINPYKYLLEGRNFDCIGSMEVECLSCGKRFFLEEKVYLTYNSYRIVEDR